MINCTGGVPYNQYINKNVSGVVSHLNMLGYSTTAIHPFFKSGYNRDNVYRFMGFDEFISLLDFDSRYNESLFASYLTEDELMDSPEGMYVRNKISDHALFQKTIEIYEKKRENGPVFIFDVTMQNHGAYLYEDYEAKTYVEETAGTDTTQMNQYMTLVKETDTAFAELISYYEKADRDVVIIMFGDHQPDIEIPLVAEEDKYIVPYVVWSNFPLNMTNRYDRVSANYLSLMLYDRCDIVFDAKTVVMQELYEKYPVISVNFIEDTAGNRIEKDKWKETNEAMLYRNLQYYYMFTAQ